MEKNGKYGDTDSWGYQILDAATGKPTIDAKGAVDCHDCQMQQKNAAFVFSALRQ